MLRNKSPNSTIYFIEVIRGIAPLFVIWAHLGPVWCLTYPFACSDPAHPWRMLALSNSITNTFHIYDFGGHIGVLLFFLVSGFIISHVAATENRLDFIVKRIFRIVPMLIVGVTLAYAISLALIRGMLEPTMGFHATCLADLIRSIVLLDWFLSTPSTLSVTWSLVTEISFYCLMIIVYRQLARFPAASTLFLIAAVAATEVAMVWAFGVNVPASFYIMQVEFVLIGRIIYLFLSGVASFRVSLLLALTAFATLSGLYMLTPYSQSVLFTSNSVVFSWTLALAIFGFALKLVKKCPVPLRFLNDISYSVYMLHIPIGSLVLNVLTLRYGIWIGWSFWISVAAVLACSCITYAKIEVPFQRFGRNLLDQASKKKADTCAAAIQGLRCKNS
jgi:peptidoglycan/LPS O-acetylase OafA/YrhL